MNDYRSRAIADSRDRVGWAKARSTGFGASDAAKFSKIESAPLYARDKIYQPFEGNGFTSHGNDREPHMLAAMHCEQNFFLFRSEHNPRHMATPDGIKVGANGEIVLVECKTTSKSFRNAKGVVVIPLSYRRQIWWQQYVLGAQRTLFVWEHHENFRPVSAEPESEIVERDDAEISKLIDIADAVQRIWDRAVASKIEMEARRG